LQRSLQEWQGEPAEVTYRAFFLNPCIPPEGYEFVPYMQAKFNGQISLEQAFDGPRRLGQEVGIVFNMDKITKAPNSLLSHCLIALAPPEVREALIEDVYAAYFEHGQDIGDRETLAQIGQRHGLSVDRLRFELTGEAVRAEVEAEARQAHRLGISGVPFFIINDKYAFSGAQPPEVILNVLRQVAQREKGEQA
jgi:predicted DsbA family dithiol-disulfide isomerase